MKVLLQDVIDAIEQTTNELHFFYYMPEEVILCYSEFDQRILDPDYEDEDIDDVSDESISLPNIQERNDYAIMQDFISTVENNEAYEWLSNSIRGRGAFRMFRATLDRFDLTKDWYDYRDNAYKEIAINWCNEYGIEYDASEIEYDEENEEEIIIPHSNIVKPSIVEINKHNLPGILYMVDAYEMEVNHNKDADLVRDKFSSYLNIYHVIYTLTLNGKSVGYIVLKKEDKNYLLQTIFVRKEERRKGYGTMLFKHAEKIANEENLY